MNSVAKKQRSQSAVHHERAIVTGAEDGTFSLERAFGSGETWRAVRALSCLVEPILGDLVLVALDDDGRGHVLAVLERTQGAPVELSLEGDVRLRSRAGRVQLTAAEGIDLVTGGAAQVVAARLDVTAGEGSFAVRAASFAGDLLVAKIDRIKTTARAIDQVVERFTQRAKTVYRTVEELERLRAKNVDQVASGTMKVHAREAVVTADGLVKMDGEQIHLG